ncbi:MAG: phosphoribosylglycinamide formyltransferase [Gemmatimonadaceae bacterium]|nr:phosphoribosylglycinamide formyltransferase [Gemmatimonadaceae bacterium]
MTPVRLAVLASGGGSNLQAIVDHARARAGRCAYDVVLVASSRDDAFALERARRDGIANVVLRPTDAGGEMLDDVLAAHGIEMIALAGYLRLVPRQVTARFAGHLLNVHPAPLPVFGGPGMYGARVHRAVLAQGATMSGPTVHLVDEAYDHGDAIAHWPVPVLSDDDPETLGRRVLRAEHLLYPRIVQLVAGTTVQPSVGTLPAFDDSLDDVALAGMLDRTLAA